MTPFPSDSFPGMVGQVTGGDPGTTGSTTTTRSTTTCSRPGTTNCSGPVPGAEVAYTEADDINPNSLDAGQGLAGLPGSILQMTSNPRHVINPAALPVDPSDLQADPTEPVPPGEHGVQRRQAARPAHRLVRQAPGLPDRCPAHPGTASRTSSPPRSTASAHRLPGRQRLDHRQRGDDGVRLAQGPGDPQRDRRLRPQPARTTSASRRSSG